MAMDFGSKPEPPLDLGPFDEAWRKWREMYRHPPYCNRRPEDCHGFAAPEAQDVSREAEEEPPAETEGKAEGEGADGGTDVPAEEADEGTEAEAEPEAEAEAEEGGEEEAGAGRRGRGDHSPWPEPDAATQDCGPSCEEKAREEQARHCTGSHPDPHPNPAPLGILTLTLDLTPS